jgi:hypothetical protein
MKKYKRDDTATLTALAHHVSPSYVRMLISGKRKNREDIVNTYQKIREAKNKWSKKNKKKLIYNPLKK